MSTITFYLWDNCGCCRPGSAWGCDCCSHIEVTVKDETHQRHIVFSDRDITGEEPDKGVAARAKILVLESDRPVSEFFYLYSSEFDADEYGFICWNCADAAQSVLRYFFPEQMREVEGCSTITCQLLCCLPYVVTCGLLRCFPAPPCISTPHTVFNQAKQVESILKPKSSCCCFWPAEKSGDAPPAEAENTRQKKRQLEEIEVAPAGALGC